MEDSNKTISPLSSPNPTSPGNNNENESDENQRNVQQKKKNFMSATISTAAKITSPKSKILSEWKSRDIESQSQFHQMGNSNSVLRSSISKSPSNSSQKNVVQSDKITDEIDDVTDGNNHAVCYDPLKNNLSPRPKFLRYRRNQKRETFGETEINHGFRDSIDSLRNENEISDEQGVVNQENLDEIEEVIEKKNCGSCIRVFLKCLITISVLFFCAMCLCPMSSSVPKHDCKGNFSIGYQHFVNLSYYDAVNVSFMAVLLRSLDFGTWGVDKRKVSKLGKIEGQDTEFRFWNEEILDEEPRELYPDFQFRSYGDECQDVECNVASEGKIGVSEVNSKAKDVESVVKCANGVSGKGIADKFEAVKDKSEVSGVEGVVTGESLYWKNAVNVGFKFVSLSSVDTGTWGVDERKLTHLGFRHLREPRIERVETEVNTFNGVSGKRIEDQSQAVMNKSEVSGVGCVVASERLYCWKDLEDKLPPGMSSTDLMWFAFTPVFVVIVVLARLAVLRYSTKILRLRARTVTRVMENRSCIVDINEESVEHTYDVDIGSLKNRPLARTGPADRLDHV